MKAKILIALGFILAAVVNNEIFTYLLMLVGLIAFFAIIIKADGERYEDSYDYYS